MTMRHLLGALVVCVLCVACGDDDKDPASSSSIAVSDVDRDWIAGDGEVLSLDENGRFWIFPANALDDTILGTWSLSEDRLTLVTDGGDTVSFDASVEGNQLHLVPACDGLSGTDLEGCQAETEITYTNG